MQLVHTHLVLWGVLACLVDEVIPAMKVMMRGEGSGWKVRWEVFGCGLQHRQYLNTVPAGHAMAHAGPCVRSCW